MRNRNPNSSNILHIVAGLYLLYLAYNLFRDGVLNGEMVGNMRIVGILASVVFFAAGVLLTGSFVKNMLKPAEDPEEAAGETDETPSEEDAGETEVTSAEEGGGETDLTASEEMPAGEENS